MRYRLNVLTPNSDVQIQPRTSSGEPEHNNYVFEPQPSTSRPTNENIDRDHSVEPLPSTSIVATIDNVHDNSVSKNLNSSEIHDQLVGQNINIRSTRKRNNVCVIESDSENYETKQEIQNVKLKKTKPTVTNKNQGKKNDLPTKKTLKQIAAEKKQAMISQWKNHEPDFELNMNCDPIPCSDEAMECETPFDFFSLFFSDDLLEYVCEQSNLYALQKNVDLNLTRDELWVFFLEVFSCQAMRSIPIKKCTVQWMTMCQSFYLRVCAATGSSRFLDFST